MTKKHRLSKTIKSFFGGHVDPEKDEELKGTKKEVEEKVRNLLKLIKNEDREGNDENAVDNSKISDLVEDLHQHYQSLYDRYDHLTGELKNKFHREQENESYYSSSNSDSDSETNVSPKQNGYANGTLDSNVMMVTNGIKRELEKANQEAIELNEKLKAAGEEVTSLKQDNRTLEIELEATREESKKLKKEVEEKVFEFEALSSDKGAEISVLSKENESLQDLNDDLEKEMKRKSLEADTLRFLEEELRIKVQESEDLIEFLRSEKDELEDKIRIISSECYGLKAEREVLLGEVADMEKIATEKADQQRVMEEKEAAYESLIEKTMAEFRFLETKVDEITESKNNTVFRLERKVLELEHALEEARREVDAKVDDIKTLKEDADRNQDLFRLEKRQFTVMKQTLAAEEKENRRLKEEQRALEAKVSDLSAKIVAEEEERVRVIRNLSEIVKTAFDGQESLFEQWVGDFEKFEKRFYRIMEEIKPAKVWAEAKTHENLVLKKKVDGLKEEKKELREKMGKLEAQMRDDEYYKEKLLRNLREQEETMNQMNEEFTELSEQKRQAIRHISEWAESKFSECSLLKDTILQMRSVMTRV